MSQTTAQPGAALRAIRETRGWTLAEVSRRTGLTISTLSKIENARVSLNFDKLSRLSAALDVDMARLLDPRSSPGAPERSPGRRSTTRADDGVVIETSNYKHLYHATDLLNKSFTPIVAELRARSMAEFGELIRHPGEEFAYVLEGVVEVHTDIYAPLVLHPGDSVFFDSGMGHAYIAGAPGPCRILSVSTDPGRGPDIARANLSLSDESSSGVRARRASGSPLATRQAPVADARQSPKGRTKQPV
ncbi:MAG TPA: XRE family transcriptional regulator [Caulobacteraceae bacterium]|jgi:transcriptional regulator with XRE-family HTH domain|nr:XRE family transcriptional regulator [Caulobacteraceae bacterium]